MLSIGKRLARSEIPLQQVRQFSSALPPHRERKITVFDADINVLETTGNAPNAPAILFLPGTLASIEMDFKPILHQLNREKYKWIAWDPPGYGGSIPPKRNFAPETHDAVYLHDVQYIKELMNIFGYPKYTLLAWSGAGLSAMSIAAEEPEKVSGLITWGAFGYVSEEMVPGMQLMKKMGLEAIREPRKTQLLKMYGEDYLLEMWNGWCEESIRMVKSGTFPLEGSFKNVINSVKCPSLVIHGMKDALVAFKMAEHLHENLRNSRLHVMETGTHVLHLKQTKEFVQCVEQFVDETSPKAKL